MLPASTRFAVAILFLCTSSSLFAEAEPAVSFADQVQPFLNIITGEADQFDLQANINVEIDGKPQEIQGSLRRWGADTFDLELAHTEYAVSFFRRSELTAMVLPLHRVAYVGRGTLNEELLRPEGFMERLVTSRTQVALFAPLIFHAKPETLSGILKTLTKFEFDPVAGKGKIDQVTIAFPQRNTLVVEDGSTHVELVLRNTRPVSEPDFGEFKTVELPRSELELQLFRGAKRAIEILAPSMELMEPQQVARKTPHGELLWLNGHRVALLHGTPEEVGQAHAELLADEAQACIDSVLYTFGTVQTIRTGRWFRQDLDAAYARLSPHIPERHKREIHAMASTLGIEPDLAQALNVFPELFHCSGFALFGKATADGKLYHGRVLDYMTAIGLQDSATTFCVQIDGLIPFVNVGYAGFTGSVSGMNQQAISLGEMGGRGEGKWDGVPMATLMRRALEECSTLDQVISLWKNSPRTCEYYYVFADGKTNDAVGVAAYPESIEFIQPGQAHPRLGEGIEDAVVLSAGERLEKLRERVQNKYGQFDVELGQWLMSRPVAMKSNLHNVLFVPEDRVLYVANADHKHPAAERPYIRIDLNEMLERMPQNADSVTQSEE